MNFSLTYSGSPGNVSATLIADGKVVETTTNLRDEKAARRWAKTLGKQIKKEARVEQTQNHVVYVTLSGTKNFTL